MYYTSNSNTYALTVINALLGTFKEEHNEVEKARGVIRTYYQYLKDVDGFEQFMEGRTKEEAVVSLVIRFMHEDEPQSEIKNKTVPEVRNRLNLALSQAETATGKSPRWIRETGANILKITLPLEKEVASGSINAAFCASGSPTNSVVA